MTGKIDVADISCTSRVDCLWPANVQYYPLMNYYKMKEKRGSPETNLVSQKPEKEYATEEVFELHMQFKFLATVVYTFSQQ